MPKMIAGLMVFLFLVIGGLALADGGTVQTWGVGRSPLFSYQESAQGTRLVLFDETWTVPVTVHLAEIEHGERGVYVKRGSYRFHVPLMITVNLPWTRQNEEDDHPA